MSHPTPEELSAALDAVRQSPTTAGTVDLIVRRPQTGEREVLSQAMLSTELGLEGDNWKARGSRATDDGQAHPDMQLNLMNSRAAAAVAGERSRWPLAGDQFYVDFDLSDANLPPGTRLGIGEAEIEVTGIPHLGCKKFTERFGRPAMLWVNSDLGKAMNLRGINARVISSGIVRSGDTLVKR